MLSVCGDAGALGTARDASGIDLASSRGEHILAGLGGVRKCGKTGACDQGRRSGPSTMIATSAGRGDAGPLRRGVTNVRRGVVALVAIGDGADAEHAHGTCSPSVEGDLRHDVGGRTRRRTTIIVIALVIVIASRESASTACAKRGGTDWRVRTPAAGTDAGGRVHRAERIDARRETRRKRPIPHRGSAASSRRALLTRL